MKRVLVALLILQIAGCGGNDNRVITKTGVALDVIKEGFGDYPIHGDVVSLNMNYKDENGLIIFETKPGDPVQFFFDTAGWRRAGQLFDVLANIKVGDSVSFDIPAEDLYHKTFALRLPDSIRAGSNLKFDIGFVSAMSEKDIERAEVALQFKTDIGLIRDYLSENNLSADSTGSGLHYIINEEGEGDNPQYGDIILVHYIGTLLDGRQFDSSYERKQPQEFTLGYGHVINGWDEGVELLKKGAKATFLIPSPLAYGPQGLGGIIGPNEVLRFDLEIIDIR